jgi:hypothetical protein
MLADVVTIIGTLDLVFALTARWVGL